MRAGPGRRLSLGRAGEFPVRTSERLGKSFGRPMGMDCTGVAYPNSGSKARGSAASHAPAGRAFRGMVAGGKAAASRRAPDGPRLAHLIYLRSGGAGVGGFRKASRQRNLRPTPHFPRLVTGRRRGAACCAPAWLAVNRRLPTSLFSATSVLRPLCSPCLCVKSLSFLLPVNF
jgi:hypothetical protein